MKVSLSDFVFLRQYGPFVYVVDSRRHIDRVYRHAEPFLRNLSRAPVEVDEIVALLREVFPDVSERILREDLEELLSSLHKDGLIKYANEDRYVNLSRRVVAGGNALKESTSDLFDVYFHENPTVFALQIEVIYNCNERCIHCYIPGSAVGVLPLGKVKEVIDEFVLHGGLILTLSGGECLLHPDIIEILNYAHSKDLIVKILSNLTLCTENILATIKATSAEVQTSLYSMIPEEHDRITRKKGSFFLTKEALLALRREGVMCSISCPVMRDNKDAFPSVYEFAKTNGMMAKMDFMIIAQMDGCVNNLGCRVSLVQAKRLLVWNTLKSIEENKEYFSAYFNKERSDNSDWTERHPCSACVSRLCIGANGDYYPCPGFGGYVLGNCYHDSMDWVWRKSEATLKMRSVVGRDFHKCFNCRYRSFCSVCLCRNYNETGNMFMPSNYTCDVAKIHKDIIDGMRANKFDINDN